MAPISTGSSTPTAASRSSFRRCSPAWATIDSGPIVYTSDRLPIVLSVGERRSFTANDIFRDPGWRKQDADGRLRISAEDAARLGLVDGAPATITTARGTAVASVEVSDAMQ